MRKLLGKKTFMMMLAMALIVPISIVMAGCGGGGSPGGNGGNYTPISSESQLEGQWTLTTAHLSMPAGAGGHTLNFTSITAGGTLTFTVPDVGANTVDSTMTATFADGQPGDLPRSMFIMLNIAFANSTSWTFADGTIVLSLTHTATATIDGDTLRFMVTTGDGDPVWTLTLTRV